MALEWNGLSINVIEPVLAGFELYPKPTARDVKQLEREIGSRLPDSFKSFIRTFGVGDLAGFFKVYGFAPSDDKASLVTAGDQHRANLEHLEEPFHAAGVDRRLVVFSTTYGGDVIGWDVEQETAGEFAVVGLPRFRHTVVPVAPTFPGFVQGVFNGSVLKALGFVERWPCKQTFQPWCRPLSDLDKRSRDNWHGK
jgi:hypothetical protein